VTVHWYIKDDHLIGRWSDGQSTSPYVSDWIKQVSTYEGETRTSMFDVGKVSPFGGAKWYAHALAETVSNANVT
jgi:hypothetical protein